MTSTVEVYVVVACFHIRVVVWRRWIGSVWSYSAENGGRSLGGVPDVALCLPVYFSGVLIFLSKSVDQVRSDGLISSPFPPSVGSFHSICCLQIFCPNLSPAGAHLKGDTLFFYWIALSGLYILITVVLLSGFYIMNNKSLELLSRAEKKSFTLGSRQGATGGEVSAEYFSSNLHSSWGWGSRGWLLRKRRWWIPRPGRSPS